MAAGSPASTTINTVVTSGVAQSVALSATGLPTGSSASFSPSTVNSGASSTMTVSTASTTPVGSYPITVTGTGGSATHSTTFTLTVTGSTGTAPQLVQSAGSSTKSVTLPAPSRGGDLLVLSAGVWTGASQPITAVSDGKNTWTKVRASAVSGQYSDGELWYAPNVAPVSSVTVTTGASAVALRLQEFSGVATTNPLDGSNGTAGHSASASSGSVTPTGANDLAVGYIAGHANAQAITVTSPGYTLQPQQTTTSPNTVSVKSGYQVLTTTTAQNFSGNFTATMYWSDGIAMFSAGHSGPPPSNDFSISTSPTSRSVAAGSPASTTINTVVTSGVAQSVALSATGLPTGSSASFSPSTVNSGASSTMTITTAPGTTPGPYTVTVTGIGTSATHTTTFALTVTTPPSNDFSISASPSSASVAAGSAATTAINTAVTSGVAQSIGLSATGAPSGSLVSFTPSSVNSGASSTMSITTASGSTPGPYTVTVTGTGTSAMHTTTFTLTVTAPSGTTPKLVQTASGTETSSATSLNGSFPTATTNGHLLVLSASVYTGSTNQITSVTDSGGNTWTRIGTAHFVSGHYSDGEMWYSANAKPVTTVTVHNASAASVAFEVQEFSGVATTNPLDVSTGTANTGTAANSGSVNSTVANELVVGFVAGHNSAQAISVTSSGYATQPQQVSTATNIATVITGVRVMATPGPLNFSGSFGTAMYWASGIATFKPGS